MKWYIITNSWSIFAQDYYINGKWIYKIQLKVIAICRERPWTKNFKYRLFLYITRNFRGNEKVAVTVQTRLFSSNYVKNDLLFFEIMNNAVLLIKVNNFIDKKFIWKNKLYLFLFLIGNPWSIPLMIVLTSVFYVVREGRSLKVEVACNLLFLASFFEHLNHLIHSFYYLFVNKKALNIFSSTINFTFLAPI